MMSYDQFEREKSSCRNCRIGLVYDRVVCSDGCKTNPVVMICGEAPGKDEVFEGRPFVGKAGKLLRSSLNSLGYNRNNSIITNVIPCRPENNQFPSDASLVRNCVDMWLKREIEILCPSYILLIGAKPLKFLLGMDGITKARGQWHSLPTNQKTECMPTFHPSYVLRKEHMSEGPDIKQKFLDDIKTVALRAEFIK